MEYITRVIASIAVNTSNREVLELHTKLRRQCLSFEPLPHFWSHYEHLHGLPALTLWINSIIHQSSRVKETTQLLLTSNSFLDLTRLRARLELAMVAAGEYKYFSVLYDSEPTPLLLPDQPTIFERWTDEERVSCVLLLFVVCWGIVYCTALIYSTLNLFNYLSK